MIRTKTFNIPLNYSGEFFKKILPDEINGFLSERGISDDSIVSIFCPHSRLCVLVYKE